MILYLDTSSFLKLFLEEEGSATVERLVRDSTRVVTSLVAYAEARAGLAKATRLGRLDEGAYRTAVIGFEQKWFNTHPVAVDTDLVRSAGNLAESYGLRGFDAVHLASALFFARESVEAVTFSAWGDRLLAAAEAEGLSVAPIS